MYAEIAMVFHDLRGFDRYEVRVEEAFDDNTREVKKMVIPKGNIIIGNDKEVKNADEYVIKNSNNDAIRVVNELLAKGKTVKWILESGDGYSMGDYLVSKTDINNLSNNYVLDLAAVNLTSVKTITLAQPKVSVNGYESTFVLKELGFNLVSRNQADVIVDNSGTELQSGKHYIGVGGGSFTQLKDSSLIPGFDYDRSDDKGRARGEGLLHGIINQNSLITAGYSEEDYLYTTSGSWITSVPEGAQVLASVSDGDDFYKAGWWPGYEGAQGQIFAFTTKIDGASITLFANDLTNRAHPRYSYRFLAQCNICGTT